MSNCSSGCADSVDFTAQDQGLSAGPEPNRTAVWWARNRPSAPNAIHHDVAEMLDVLCMQPGIGATARRSRAKGVRRVTLARVRYYTSTIGCRESLLTCSRFGIRVEVDSRASEAVTNLYVGTKRFVNR